MPFRSFLGGERKAWIGGTPNFDERTGSYIDRPAPQVKGSPRPYPGLRRPMPTPNQVTPVAGPGASPPVARHGPVPTPTPTPRPQYPGNMENMPRIGLAMPRALMGFTPPVQEPTPVRRQFNLPQAGPWDSIPRGPIVPRVQAPSWIATLFPQTESPRYDWLTFGRR